MHCSGCNDLFRPYYPFPDPLHFAGQWNWADDRRRRRQNHSVHDQRNWRKDQRWDFLNCNKILFGPCPVKMLPVFLNWMSSSNPCRPHTERFLQDEEDEGGISVPLFEYPAFVFSLVVFVFVFFSGTRKKSKSLALVSKMRESGENNFYYGFIDDTSPPCPVLFAPCSKIPTSSLGIPGPRSRSRRRGLGTGTICWVYLSGLWSGIETWIHQSQQFSSNNINHYNKNKTRNISSYAAILTVDAYEFPNHQRKTFALLGCAG